MDKYQELIEHMIYAWKMKPQQAKEYVDNTFPYLKTPEFDFNDTEKEGDL